MKVATSFLLMFLQNTRTPRYLFNCDDYVKVYWVDIATLL